MTPDDDKFLSEVSARAERATSGPWQTRFLYRVIRSARSYDGLHIQTDADQDWNDSNFAAHARTDVPKLVQIVRERDAEIARLLKDEGAACNRGNRLARKCQDLKSENERLRKMLDVARIGLVCHCDLTPASNRDCAACNALAELDRLEKESQGIAMKKDIPTHYPAEDGKAYCGIRGSHRFSWLFQQDVTCKRCIARWKSGKPMTSILAKLETLKALCDKATPACFWQIPTVRTDMAGWHGSGPSTTQSKAKEDAQFIAASRTALPQLVEALRVAVKQLEEFADDDWDDSIARKRSLDALDRIQAILEGKE